MKQKNAYDAIGKSFGEFTDTAAQRAVEIRTMMHMAGDVRGLRVLDLACGYGFFGRELLAVSSAAPVVVRRADIAAATSRAAFAPVFVKIAGEQVSAVAGVRAVAGRECPAAFPVRSPPRSYRQTRGCIRQ